MSRTINLEQAHIALDDIGDGDPVLLLHGFPATRHLWSQVAPMLAAAGFRALVPDLAGYGASEAVATESVGMSSQARWMFELLDALGIGRAAVVAHDVGSAAAQLMVANAPLRLIRAARDLDPRQTEHLAAALRASGVPALVLWGERDDFLPVDTVARPLAKLLGAKLIVLPGGHFTPVDCPREVAEALCSFLRGLAPDR